jgi:hypothetical protein
MSYAYPQVKVVSPDDREILPDAGKAFPTREREV